MSKINAFSRVLNRKGKTRFFLMDFLLWTALTWLRTNKTDLHDITEILLKVAFNTITLILIIFSFLDYFDKLYLLDFARSNLR